MSEVHGFKKPEIKAELPVQPVGWRVLIRPFEAQETYGDSELIIAGEALESEEYLTYVGQIVAMGNQCYKAITRSGINLDEVDPKPQVGDWIIYGTYGGQKVHMKDGVKYLLMNDDGIMGIVSEPALFRAHI